MLPDEDARRERLAARTGNRDRFYNPRYSLIIKRLRLILPVIAVMIAALVFVWGSVTQETIIPLENGELGFENLGKNELINPRFESRDTKNQPFTVTANRALQNEDDENLVLLEEPTAAITLTGGNKINMSAHRGAYHQDDQRLVLDGAVKLLHDAGYTMDTEKLHFNITQNQSWTDTAVSARGPEGTLSARGLRGDSAAQTLKFIGPAKMVITNGKLSALSSAPSQKETSP